MKKLIFFFITVFIFGTSYAQNSVSGTVVDSEVGSGHLEHPLLLKEHLMVFQPTLMVLLQLV